MASITLSDNVLNATETATVTFTFDADYALAPANITAIGGTLSTPPPLPPPHPPPSPLVAPSPLARPITPAFGARLPPPAPSPPGQPRVGKATFPPATAATQRADCTITVNNDAGGVLAQSNSFTVDNVRPDII